MKKNLKPIPKFKTEAEERRFWEGRDSSQYVDWSSASKFAELKAVYPVDFSASSFAPRQHQN